MDVVLGSEVIEHVPSPRAFVRTLRAMLKPGGVLVLTTPNGERPAPSMPSGASCHCCSPGLHLVFQNPASLRHLLADAGFVHVQVETDSHSLVAFAATRRWCSRPIPTLRAGYREAPAARGPATPPGSDVVLGFAGRALQEAVNDADAAAAERAWADAAAGLPRPVRHRSRHARRAARRRSPRAGLEEMARPDAAQSWRHALRRCDARIGGRRGASLARAPASRLRPTPPTRCVAPLGELAMEDGLTEQIGWIARAEALLCVAAGGASDRRTPARPARRARRRGHAHSAGAIAERALVGLVNAAALRLAARRGRRRGPARRCARAATRCRAARRAVRARCWTYRRAGDPARAAAACSTRPRRACAQRVRGDPARARPATGRRCAAASKPRLGRRPRERRRCARGVAGLRRRILRWLPTSCLPSSRSPSGSVRRPGRPPAGYARPARARAPGSGSTVAVARRRHAAGHDRPRIAARLGQILDLQTRRRSGPARAVRRARIGLAPADRASGPRCAGMSRRWRPRRPCQAAAIAARGPRRRLGRGVVPRDLRKRAASRETD